MECLGARRRVMEPEVGALPSFSRETAARPGCGLEPRPGRAAPTLEREVAMRIALRSFAPPFLKNPTRITAAGRGRPLESSDLLPVRRAVPAGDVWRMDVPGVGAAIPLLRRWVRLLLADEPELAEAFELIVSEYGTNALWHSASGSPGGRIRTELCVDAQRARLTVLDDGPWAVSGDSMPVDLDEHGRGLVLAGAYADEVGYHDTAGGRAAWALIDR